MELKPYKTLLAEATGELVINKSRFLCHGCPVQSEEQALEYLRKIRAVQQDATHNCYAYAIGANMGIMRYSDDGEPGGTAGLPMMEVIKAKQLTNCIIVVTRYFGGVLLGAGGLVRAYSQGAALAAEVCGMGTVYPTSRYSVQVAYSLLGKTEYALKSLPVLVEDKQFTDAVTLTIAVRTKDENAFTAELTSALDGKAVLIRLSEDYRAWED